MNRLVLKAKNIPPGVRSRRGTNCALDLSDCERVDPGALLLIMYTALQLGSEGWSLWVTASGPNAAMKTVRMNVDHLMSSALERKKLPRQIGEYPMRWVSEPGKMVQELEEWSDTVKEGTNANPRDVALWQMQISEVTVNGFQHCRPELINRTSVPPILLAGNASDETSTAQLAVLDRGAGIPRVIERVLTPDMMSWGDGKKIAHACKPGVTSRCSPLNQGAGLPTLVSAVKANRGSMQILSRRGLAYVRGGRMYMRSLGGGLPRLEGTFTMLELKFTE